MVLNRLWDLFSLTRPLDWSKTFASMVLGYFAALVLAGSNARFDLVWFATAFIIVGPLLSGGLYVLNDWTDWKKDQKHAAKKERSIAAGKIKPSTALAFGVFLVLVSFGFAFFLNNALLLVSMSLMLLNQWLYTMEPFYLKKHLFVDMITGSIVLPVFRFLSGWALVTQGLESLPISLLVFTVAIQYVFYSIFRLSSRDLEKELGFKSSVVVFSPNTIIGSSIIAFLLAVIAYTLACLTVLPAKFLVPLLLSGFLIPHYIKALENPEHIQFKKMKKIVYLHFYGFAIAFAILYFI